jgi:hypothetical protein
LRLQANGIGKFQGFHGLLRLQANGIGQFQGFHGLLRLQANGTPLSIPPAAITLVCALIERLQEEKVIFTQQCLACRCELCT